MIRGLVGQNHRSPCDKAQGARGQCLSFFEHHLTTLIVDCQRHLRHDLPKKMKFADFDAHSQVAWLTFQLCVDKSCRIIL